MHKTVSVQKEFIRYKRIFWLRMAVGWGLFLFSCGNFVTADRQIGYIKYKVTWGVAPTSSDSVAIA